MNRLFQKMMTALACLTVVAVLGANTMTAEAAPRVLGSQPAGTTTTEQPADNEAEQPADNEAEQPADAAVPEEGTNAAGPVGNGTVTADSVRVRADATTSSDVVGNAAQGTAVVVTGEKSDGEGNVWYAVSFESEGETITGYIRSDLMSYEAIAVPEVPEAPAEEIPAEEIPIEEVPADDYYVEYTDDGTGTSDWYLFDQMMGKHYKVSDLLSAQEISTSNQASMEKQVGTLRMIIVFLAIVVLVLIGVVTFFIIKLRNVSEGYEDDDDEEDDEDEEEEEDEEPVRRRGFFARRRAEEEDEDDEDEDDEEEEEERPVRRAAARRSVSVRASRRYEEEEEEDEDEEEEYQPRHGQKSSRSQKDKNWQSKNFLDDDDLEFEFLDLK